MTLAQGTKRPTGTPRVAGVLLAAGLSRRMGQTNKLLIELNGTALVRRVAMAMVASQAHPIVVVVGHEANRVCRALAGLPLCFVDNANYAEGMSTSLRAGIKSLAGQQLDGAVVGLGDMPWLQRAHFDSLIDAFDPNSESTICVPIFGTKRGNPVLWSATHFADLSTIEGDVGGKALFERFPASICYVTMSEAGVNVDVDTPDDLAQRRPRLGQAE